VGAFTGVPGVADTELAFVSDRTKNKEIFVMEADGANVRQATAHKTINTFPNWSPDSTTIVYTSYRHANRPQLFLLTRGTRSPGRILRELNGAQIYRGVFDRAAASWRWCATSRAGRRSTAWGRAAAA
jgi:Tol biopolymer transport system component